jgi:hypothetical protein
MHSPFRSVALIVGALLTPDALLAVALETVIATGVRVEVADRLDFAAVGALLLGETARLATVVSINKPERLSLHPAFRGIGLLGKRCLFAAAALAVANGRLFVHDKQCSDDVVSVERLCRGCALVNEMSTNVAGQAVTGHHRRAFA